MATCLAVIGNMLSQLFTLQMPWGISYGSVIVGAFGLPLVVVAFKKFF